MKNLISIPIIIFLFLCVFGCGLETNNNTAKTDANKQLIETNKQPVEENAAEKPVHSTELVEAFKKDKEAANYKYKDKTILISGKITNINDVFGVKALNLRDSENALGLQTYLADNKDVEKVKIGDEVIIRGKVRGDGTDVIDGAVIIKVN